MIVYFKWIGLIIIFLIPFIVCAIVGHTFLKKLLIRNYKNYMTTCIEANHTIKECEFYYINSYRL